MGRAVSPLGGHAQELRSARFVGRLRMGESHHFLPLALSIAITLAAAAAYAGEENFDAAKPGTIPEDWICGVTGRGSATWKVEADSSAPSQPNVLK